MAPGNLRLCGLDTFQVKITSEGTDWWGQHTEQDVLTAYTHHDRLGSIVNLTDKYGRNLARADYQEYGEIAFYESITVSGGYRRIAPQLVYTNHEWDDVLDLYYAKARFYDPAEKRFLSMDPVKGTVIDPQSLVPYVYCVDNPLKYTDPLGQWPFLDGILAHLAIERYLSNLYGFQDVFTNVYIKKYKFSISKRGYADVIMRKKGFWGNYYEVYEIKPLAAYKSDWRRELAHKQVDGYVTAINENRENGSYQKARLGSSILKQIDGKKLRMPGENKRYIVIHTYSGFFDHEDGMIYYEILGCAEGSVEYDYVFTRQDEKAWENYLSKASDYEDAPAYALSADSENDLEFDNWLSNVEVDYSYDDWGFGLLNYTRIMFPDGSERYRLDGFKGLVTPQPLDFVDYIDAYQTGTLDRTWFKSPFDAFMGELSNVPVMPGGGPVLVPVV